MRILRFVLAIIIGTIVVVASVVWLAAKPATLNTVVITGIICLWFGFAICAYMASFERQRFLKKHVDSTKQSGEIQDQHYSATAMAYRSALVSIEAGDIEGAKQQLSDSIASFYQIQSAGRRDLALIGIKPGEPDWTGRELRAIEQDAKRFESLRVALARKPAVSLEELVNERHSPDA
jgi:hypothetical protein